MSLADEMLNNISDSDMQSRTAEPESEGHIVVDNNRNVMVPNELKEIAVQFDHNIETVTFDCPRYWDGNDMSVMRIYINYKRPDNILGCYLVDNVTVDETDHTIMHFNWKIEKHVTMVSGNLTFLVCIKKADNEGNEVQHWNSKLNTEIFILEGLECDEEIFEAYPSVFDKLVLDAVNQSHADAEQMVTNHTHNYAGSQEVGGAANSALKLENPININGIPFDGSTDIEIPTGNDGPVHSIRYGNEAYYCYVKIGQINFIKYQSVYTITIVFKKSDNLDYGVYKLVFKKSSEDAELKVYRFDYYGKFSQVYIKKISDSTWDLYIRSTNKETIVDIMLCDFPNDTVSITWGNEIIGRTLQLDSTSYPQLMATNINITGSSNSSSISERSKNLIHTGNLNVSSITAFYIRLCEFTLQAGQIMCKYMLLDQACPKNNAEIYVYAFKQTPTAEYTVPPTLIVNPIGPYKPNYFIIHDESASAFSVWLYTEDATIASLKWYKVAANYEMSGTHSDDQPIHTNLISTGTRIDAEYSYDYYLHLSDSAGHYQATSTTNSIDVDMEGLDKYASVLVNMNIHSNDNDSLAYHQVTLPVQYLISSINSYEHDEKVNLVFANGAIVPTRISYAIKKADESTNVYTLTITITSGTGVISYVRVLATM